MRTCPNSDCVDGRVGNVGCAICASPPSATDESDGYYRGIWMRYNDAADTYSCTHCGAEFDLASDAGLHECRTMPNTSLDLDALERAPMVHGLKCWPDPFQAMLDGLKPYEIRRADRDYRVGDTLWLREWNPCEDYTGPNEGVRKLIMPHGYSGREVRREITYITEGGEWGLPADLCVLGLSPDAALVAAARRGVADTERLTELRTAAKGVIAEADRETIAFIRLRAALVAADTSEGDHG